MKQPADSLKRRYAVDQPLVDRYAEVSTDRNPLHIDPAFGATTHFGRTIAHGFMTLAFLSDALTHAFGMRWVQGGELDVAFVAPVFPGDTVEVTLQVETVAERRLNCTVLCAAGERTVLAGKASVDIELETANVRA